MSRSIVKNSLFNIASKGFNVLYPMITSAYISRIFLADGVGQIMFVINIVTYFSLAASLGLPNYAIKVISGCRDNKTLLNRHFTEFSIILAFSSLVFSIIYYAIVPYIYNDSHNLISLALILGLIIVTNATNYDWLFESLEDFRYLAYRSIVVKCILLLCMFLFVKEKSDILIYCGIYTGISVFNNVWNFVSFKRYAAYDISKIEIKEHVKPIVFLFAAAFATECYTLLDSTMLGVLCKSEYLGYYSNASKLVRAFYGLIFAVIAVYNPRLSHLYGINEYTSYRKSMQRFYDIALVISVPSALFLYFAANPITIFLFGEPFLPAANTLKILSFLIIIFSLATVFGHFALIIYGKEKLLLVCTIIGAIVNFSLNQVLIPLYFHNGAAIASVISEIIVTSMLVIFSLRCFKINMLTKNLFQVLIAAVISVIVICVFPSIQLSCIFQIFILAFLVLLVFVLILLLQRNLVVLQIYQTVKTFHKL